MAEKTVSAESGSTLATIGNLWPYIWPSGRPDLKLRVAWATVFLVTAKLVLILVPYFFKWATDALNGDPTVASWMPALIARRMVMATRTQRKQIEKKVYRRDAESAEQNRVNPPKTGQASTSSCLRRSVW